MKNLSFNRIWQLIRYYWRTEKKLYLRLFLGLVALYLIIGLILHIFAHLFSIDDFGIFRMLFNEEWIFWGFILICTARMFYVLEKKQTATTFLSLPASNIEKYLSRVVYATISIRQQDEEETPINLELLYNAVQNGTVQITNKTIES